jgi:AraC-like DNA-binding protein
MDSHNRHDPGVPGAYVILLLDVVSRWGISDHTMLGPFSLNREQLADPNNRVPAHIVNELLKRAHLLTGESTLAYHLGTQMRISTHGFIGFAIMTAPDVGTALMLASRFIRTRMPYCRLDAAADGGMGDIQFTVDLPLEPLRSEIILSLYVGILFMGQALIDQPIHARLELDFAQPKGFERFSKLIDSELKFGQPALVARFDPNLASARLVSADPVASQLALTQCEAELSALGQRDRLSARVRELLVMTPNGFPNIEHVAERLCMSDRTLKRQLAAEDTSFSALLEEVRHRQAIGLLSRTDLSLERISEQLGYSDVANFNRAFRRWTGKTPGRWRREPVSRDQ